MRLKCIGGPMNSTFWDIGPNIRVGDITRVREPRKYDLKAPIFLDPYKASEMMTDIIHYYRMAQFNIDQINYKFLVFEKLTDKDAIRIALTQ